MLFIVSDGEPVLHHLYAAACQHFFKFRHRAEKFFIFLIGTKTHDALDAGAVVPAAVEQHNFTSGRQMRHITLEIPLGAFAIVRRGQGGDAANTRVQALRDAFDDATFAGCIPAFKQNHHPVPGGNHPIL